MRAIVFILMVLAAYASNTAANVPRNARVDCAPSPHDTKEDCLARGCFWDNHFEELNPSVPLCYFPQKSGYMVVGENDDKSIRLKRLEFGAKNPYDKQIEFINVKFKQIRKSTLKVTIGSDQQRYIPLVPLNEGDDCDGGICSSTDEILNIQYQKSPVFSFTISRPNGYKIWDTSIGGLMFADKYIQIATYLPTEYIYGFGENIHQHFKHDFSEYRTFAMFSMDEPTNSVSYNNNNHYGVQPFYLGFDPNSGKAHGVFIFNSNAQEITIGQAPHLVYRTIGGQLDIYFFAGPTPEDVVRQYEDLIGRPYLPSYWAFGYQLCRYNYTGTKDIRGVVQRTLEAKIPFDVIYSDIDYMDRYKDFTLNPNENWKDFPKFIDEIHSQNLKLILIFDPAIQVNDGAFERAVKKGATFLEWPRKDLVPKYQKQYPLVENTKVMLGVVWPDEHVAFPDFLDPQNITQKWWSEEFQEFHKKIAFDGIWIDMNEPSNFETDEDNPHYPSDHPILEPLRCPLNGEDSEFDKPPYATWHVFSRKAKTLSSKTVCMLARSSRGRYLQYDVHSIYGWSESVATNAALYATTGERGSLFTRSTYPGTGAYAGHWLGDNFARWEDMRTSIIGIQEFNIFGIPFVGADVCGFIGATTEELCLRWQQLGAFYPFFRNHNDGTSPPQDPAQWKSVAIATRVANLFRYEHLPYLFSLYFRASLYGGTVVRPMFFEFPFDATAINVADSQFMWGPSMIIIPVTSPDVDFVHGYLPPSEIWYSASFAHDYGIKMAGGFSDFNAPRDTPLPVFLRGGTVIPQQKPSMTLTESRKNPFKLLVALDSSQYEIQQARGMMFWDDGKTIFKNQRDHDYVYLTFTVKVVRNENTYINISCEHGCDSELLKNMPPLDTIEVFGYEQPPSFKSATLNGKPIILSEHRSSYSPVKKILKLFAPSMVDFSKNGPNWTLYLKNLHFLFVPQINE